MTMQLKSHIRLKSKKVDLCLEAGPVVEHRYANISTAYKNKKLEIEYYLKKSWLKDKKHDDTIKIIRPKGNEKNKTKSNQ